MKFEANYRTHHSWESAKEQERAEERLLRSDSIVFGIQDDLIITTSTVKNPVTRYSTCVFRESQSPFRLMTSVRNSDILQLTPISEGKGYCA